MFRLQTFVDWEQKFKKLGEKLKEGGTKLKKGTKRVIKQRRLEQEAQDEEDKDIMGDRTLIIRYQPILLPKSYELFKPKLQLVLAVWEKLLPHLKSQEWIVHDGELNKDEANNMITDTHFLTTEIGIQQPLFGGGWDNPQGFYPVKESKPSSKPTDSIETSLKMTIAIWTDLDGDTILKVSYLYNVEKFIVKESALIKLKSLLLTLRQNINIAITQFNPQPSRKVSEVTDIFELDESYTDFNQKKKQMLFFFQNITTPLFKENWKIQQKEEVNSKESTNKIVALADFEKSFEMGMAVISLIITLSTTMKEIRERKQPAKIVPQNQLIIEYKLNSESTQIINQAENEFGLIRKEIKKRIEALK